MIKTIGRIGAGTLLLMICVVAYLNLHGSVHASVPPKQSVVAIRDGANGQLLAGVTESHALRVYEVHPVPTVSGNPGVRGEIAANQTRDIGFPKTLVVCVINGSYTPDFFFVLNNRRYPYNLNGQVNNAHRSMCASVPPVGILRTDGNVIDYQATY